MEIVDLKKLKKEDWIKYKQMDKIASRSTNAMAMLHVYILVALTIAIIGYGVFVSAPAIHITSAFLVSASTQLDSSFKAAGLGNITIYNNTALVANHLASNPQALASFAIWMYAIGVFFAAMMPLLLTAFLLYVMLTIFQVFGRHAYDINSFGALQRRLRMAQRSRSALRARGFSEHEIDWYYEVKEVLGYLKYVLLSDI